MCVLRGDQVPDLAVANWHSDDVSVLLGVGDGTFAVAVNYAAGDIDCGPTPGPCDLPGLPGCGQSADNNENGIPDECEGPQDSDGDGVPDDVDSCPNSDLGESIIIDDCDTGVANELFDDGCTMADRIAECAEGVTTHGEFVSCGAQLANDWKQDGLISGREKARIQSCAAQGNPAMKQPMNAQNRTNGE